MTPALVLHFRLPAERLLVPCAFSLSPESFGPACLAAAAADAIERMRDDPDEDFWKMDRAELEAEILKLADYYENEPGVNLRILASSEEEAVRLIVAVFQLEQGVGGHRAEQKARARLDLARSLLLGRAPTISAPAHTAVS